MKYKNVKNSESEEMGEKEGMDGRLKKNQVNVKKI
jgi:hypothetical protein